MVCPKCKLEAGIFKSGYVIGSEHDVPQLYIKQTFHCRNPKCSEYGKEVGAIKNPLELLKDAPETE